MTTKNRYLKDLLLVFHYTGYVILGTAGLMLIPVVVSILCKEWSIVFDFLISLNISLVLGFTLIMIGNNAKKTIAFQWRHGLIISSLSWIILMILCALPYLLSKGSASLIDACFDVMSGFTTTGLALIRDMDHLSYGINTWRHILTFVGGQGMVVLALTFLFKEAKGAYKVYVGEGKDVELMPNVKGTSRIIWRISMIYLLIGTISLTIAGLFIGLGLKSAFFHGFFIFCSSWSTGGFAPMSQNIMYYHSFLYENITIILFVLGSLNFGIHHFVMTGRFKELVQNIEIKSFVITASISSLFLTVWFIDHNIYEGAITLFRKGIYHLLSAHTTTGFGTVFSRQFALEWGEFGVLVMIIVMLIGGSACSTAGGFKGLRVAIIFKSIINDIRKYLAPERKITVVKYHHFKNNIMSDDIIKASSLIVILYMVLFLINTSAGVWYGYPLLDAAFEAASITGNVGLSIGVTTAAMPDGLKAIYIISMYLARLEFISVFTFIGFILGGVKNTCVKIVSH